MTGPETVGAVAGGGGLVLALGGLVFKLGQHSQRLADVEKDVGELKLKAGEHETKLGALGELRMAMAAIQEGLRELSHDVKNLLTGRVVPARRREEG